MARVLLAESDPKAQQVLQVVLQRRGHRVVSSKVTEAPQHLLMTESPDALICSDPSLASRACSASPKVRVLLLSRGLRTGTLAGAANRSFVYVVHTPWSLGELSEALDLVLRDDPSTH
ncbi:MAG: hypothetical protein QM765_32970 [Myxococcales bacterium]